MYLTLCDFNSSYYRVITDLTVLVYCFQEGIQGIHVKHVHNINGIREIVRNTITILSCDVV